MNVINCVYMQVAQVVPSEQQEKKKGGKGKGKGASSGKVSHFPSPPKTPQLLVVTADQCA